MGTLRMDKSIGGLKIRKTSFYKTLLLFLRRNNYYCLVMVETRPLTVQGQTSILLTVNRSTDTTLSFQGGKVTHLHRKVRLDVRLPTS